VTVTPTDSTGRTFDIANYTYAGQTAPNDFSVSATPVVDRRWWPVRPRRSPVSTAVTSGVAEPVALSATGAPAGALVSFLPPTVNSGNSTTMTVTTSATTPPGSYPIEVTGTGPVRHRVDHRHPQRDGALGDDAHTRAVRERYRVNPGHRG